jgi:hypothetical protein
MFVAESSSGSFLNGEPIRVNASPATIEILGRHSAVFSETFQRGHPYSNMGGNPNEKAGFGDGRLYFAALRMRV